MTDATLIQALISDFFSMLALAVILLGVPFVGWAIGRIFNPARRYERERKARLKRRAQLLKLAREVESEKRAERQARLRSDQARLRDEIRATGRRFWGI